MRYGRPLGLARIFAGGRGVAKAPRGGPGKRAYKERGPVGGRYRPPVIWP